MQDPRRPLGGGEQQLGAQGARRLGEGALGVVGHHQAQLIVGQPGLRRGPHVDTGDQAQHRRLHQGLRLLHRLDAVVQGIQQEGQRHPQEQPQGQAHRQIQLEVGLVRRDGQGRRVGDGDVVLADTGRHPHLLHALQQAIVQLAAGLHLALEGLVVGAAVLQGQGLILQLIDLLVQLGLFLGLGLVLGLDALGDQLGLALDLAVQLRDLLAQLLHLGVTGLEELAVLLVGPLQLRPPLLEGLDHLAFQRPGHGLGTRRHQLLVLGLRLDARPLGLDQLPVHLRQFLQGDLQPVVGIDDLPLPGIADEALLGVLQGGPRLLQLLGEEALGVGGGVIAPLQVQGDVVAGDGVDHLHRLRRAGALVVDAHQARVPQGLHGQVFEEGVLRLGRRDGLRVQLKRARRAGGLLAPQGAGPVPHLL